MAGENDPMDSRNDQTDDSRGGITVAISSRAVVRVSGVRQKMVVHQSRSASVDDSSRQGSCA